MTIGNHQFAKWPPNNLAACQAYAAAAGVVYGALVNEANAVWAIPREDAHGNWTVGTLRAPYSVDGVNPVPFNQDLEDLLADAVIVNLPEWPIVEEE